MKYLVVLSLLIVGCADDSRIASLEQTIIGLEVDIDLLKADGRRYENLLRRVPPINPQSFCYGVAK